jgi:hypothetical protein
MWGELRWRGRETEQGGPQVDLKTISKENATHGCKKVMGD